jgi:hypothetical protein
VAAKKKKRKEGGRNGICPHPVLPPSILSFHQTTTSSIGMPQPRPTILSSVTAPLSRPPPPANVTTFIPTFPLYHHKFATTIKTWGGWFGMHFRIKEERKG